MSCRLGIITGSGTYSLGGFESVAPRDVQTPFGTAHVNTGHLSGMDVVHVSRHLEGHRRLSSHVTHQANISALMQLRVDAVLAVTVCGACDVSVELGSLIVFDDLHFLANRLPDGSLCTLHTEPGKPGRGHWIYDRPRSKEHTSELQSRENLVCRLLLEKKKNKTRLLLSPRHATATASRGSAHVSTLRA